MGPPLASGMFFPNHFLVIHDRPEPLAWQLMMLLASGWHLTPEMLRAKHDTKVVLRI
jgi:hypothetical protein